MVGGNSVGKFLQVLFLILRYFSRIKVKTEGLHNYVWPVRTVEVFEVGGAGKMHLPQPPPTWVPVDSINSTLGSHVCCLIKEVEILVELLRTERTSGVPAFVPAALPRCGSYLRLSRFPMS
jgi:hypothetical protein